MINLFCPLGQVRNKREKKHKSFRIKIRPTTELSHFLLTRWRYCALTFLGHRFMSFGLTNNIDFQFA